MVIFDFDGTLADTISLGITLLNSYSEKFGYKKLDLEKNKGLSALQLMSVAQISFWKLPYIVWFFKKKLAENGGQIKMISGVEKMLGELKNSGFKMGILTSNSLQTVQAFLKKYGIESYFSYIKTDVPLFGKKRALNKARRQLKSDFIYVGDELRDVEACRKTGIPVVSVSWGFNSFDILEQNNPKMVARNSEEAVNLICALSDLNRNSGDKK